MYMDGEFIRVFRAFTDKHRIRVLELLSDGEQCACVLLEDLEIGQPTLSYHMKILCASGVVSSRRIGTWNYYSIDEDGCKRAIRMLESVKNGKMGSFIFISATLDHALRILDNVLAGACADKGSAGCCCASA
jgi:ArsR family transcriptional regulator